MTSYIFGRHGIPALACSMPDGAPPSSCTLSVVHAPDDQQATVLLQFPILVPGSDQKQSFTFRYDADNLVPGTTSLKGPTVSPPQALLEGIARHGSPRIKTLLLALKHPCSVWCPRSPASVAPEDARQHVDFANAKEVHILFDYNRLHKDKRESSGSSFAYHIRNTIHDALFCRVRDLEPSSNPHCRAYRVALGFFIFLREDICKRTYVISAIEAENTVYEKRREIEKEITGLKAQVNEQRAVMNELTGMTALLAVRVIRPDLIDALHVYRAVLFENIIDSFLCHGIDDLLYRTTLSFSPRMTEPRDFWSRHFGVFLMELL
ncbi:hypothetical protein BDV96DRAFT_605793 [Lophiotrema nucula]|uniref:Uncharacterized protein n=1 Tax=Lophiotrema nucula TaxID=690887 RepID=A0A6A5YNB6_9PLEO|nr:hypothetical protein BDV96DRAFT_605793 [Lophiotrema nucula]